MFLLKRVIPPSVFLTLLLFWQCQEPQKGCLDARATNFDVTAAVVCEEDCCTYPNLKIEFEYAFDTFDMRLGTLYKLGNDSIKILNSQFYISQVEVANNTIKASVLDSVLLFRENDTIRVPNYYALVGRNQGFEASLGKFNSIGNFTKLRFLMGLNAEAAKTIPTKMAQGSPLSIKADSMYISSEKQYIMTKMVLVRASKPTDTLRFNIKTIQNIELSSLNPIVIKEGFDAKIPLKIDYNLWFQGVNFNDPANLIQEKIVFNTKRAFILNP